MLCNKCHKEKELEEFPKLAGSKKGYRAICKDCSNKKHREWWKKTNPIRLEYSKKWYADNREKIIKQKVSGNLKYRRLAKLDCIEHYSDGKNCCDCCGEKHIEFLGIDHKEGNGRKHRESIKEYLPLYLKKHGYPKGFRILCHNCNMSLGFFGYCPHKTKEVKE
ncbi:MAG: hypothetical protein NT076_03735 [Candidatus Pacearchaeota archaeon]|nr:hypothetical protein [Candidatus Pacearchaeota archaeon]